MVYGDPRQCLQKEEYGQVFIVSITYTVCVSSTVTKSCLGKMEQRIIIVSILLIVCSHWTILATDYGKLIGSRFQYFSYLEII